MLLVSVVSFVFTMLFHAAVARTLGNGVLLHQSYWFIAAPFVQVGALHRHERDRRHSKGRGNEPGAFAFAMLSVFQIVLTILVYGWYAAICWQTFRTMDSANRRQFE